MREIPGPAGEFRNLLYYPLHSGGAGLPAERQWVRLGPMPSKPIPGSSGEVLTTLPSAYLPHAATGLLHLPRFLAKAKYVKAQGALPPSYAKNYKRGMDRSLSLHLGIDPAAVEKIVFDSPTDAELEAKLIQLLPADVRAAKWNRDY